MRSPMESRPPQDPPRRPAGARKPNGNAGAPTPPWLWLVLIAGFLLIAYNYSFFRSETEVSYAWFLDQVDDDNVKAIRIQQGTEVTGELRAPTSYQPLRSQQSVTIRRFTTYFPSESAIQPV